MQNPAALYPLIRTFEMEYARLVQDLKKQTSQQKKREGNPTVEQCKDYIFKHLHEKIRIPDIARELYLNPNYLSNLFRRHEGISIVDFVAQEKLKLVKNLLTYSNYSYIEIASYLGFSSQSHLGKQFKAQTGMTLKQYRDKYHVREFL
ncbi:MAG: helix-turn-helix domain-containing protein [Blautia hansenii]